MQPSGLPRSTRHEWTPEIPQDLPVILQRRPAPQDHGAPVRIPPAGLHAVDELRQRLRCSATHEGVPEIPENLPVLLQRRRALQALRAFLHIADELRHGLGRVLLLE
jgi:hypothetical protein